MAGCRKKAGHSVTWLDAVEVAGKQLYSAVASAAARARDWLAVLEMPAVELEDEAWLVARRIDPQKYQVVSLSGHGRDRTAQVTLLGQPGKGKLGGRAGLPAGNMALILNAITGKRSYLSVNSGYTPTAAGAVPSRWAAG